MVIRTTHGHVNPAATATRPQPRRKIGFVGAAFSGRRDRIIGYDGDENGKGYISSDERRRGGDGNMTI